MGDVWKRSDVLETAKIAAAIADNPARPQALRIEGQRVYEQCERILLYEDDPEKRIRLVPYSLLVKRFYQDFVSDRLARLDEDVKTQKRTQALMAEQMAKLVDNHDYSSTFRLESLDALRAVLRSLDDTEQGLHLVGKETS